MQLIGAKRTSFIYHIIMLAFIVSIILSWKLWVSDRLFPLVPVIDSLASFHTSINYVLFGLLIFLTAAACCFQNRILLIVLFLLLLFLLLQDQNRWQPWVYTYMLLLLPFVFRKKPEHQTIHNYMRILIIGVYLWSGLHKLNAGFINNTFRLILTDFLGIEDPELIGKLLSLGYSIGIIEIAVAIFLCFSKIRNPGVVVALASHVFILLYLSPVGINANTVVYPWNVAMPILIVALFYKAKVEITLRSNNKLHTVSLFAVIVTWILPALNLFGYWDNYLSFSLYSDKEAKYYIAVDERSVGKIKHELQNYFAQVPGMTGGRLIDVSDWSLSEMNVPMYPEHRVFKHVAKTFCVYGIPADQLYFVEVKNDGSVVKFGCGE